MHLPSRSPVTSRGNTHGQEQDPAGNITLPARNTARPRPTAEPALCEPAKSRSEQLRGGYQRGETARVPSTRSEHLLLLSPAQTRHQHHGSRTKNRAGAGQTPQGSVLGCLWPKEQPGRSWGSPPPFIQPAARAAFPPLPPKRHQRWLASPARGSLLERPSCAATGWGPLSIRQHFGAAHPCWQRLLSRFSPCSRAPGGGE